MTGKLAESGARLVVVYDGDCAMCDATRCWVERRDRQHRLEFQAINNTTEVRGRRFVRADLDAEMHVVDADGRVYRGYTAWQRVAAEVPSMARAAAVVGRLVPDHVGASAYRWIARHRRPLSRCLRFNRRRKR